VKISVFTPSHSPQFLDECHASLTRQTFTDWEWIVVLNADAPDWSPPQEDERIKVIRGSFPRKVGAVKRAACELCTGEILLELDHDDVLIPTCLAEVHDAFATHPEVSLVYSDFAQVNEDLSPNAERFNPAMGWEYSDVDIEGTTYLRCHALGPSPHNVSYIWYAPNHVRAFRRDVYEAVGGYNADLAVLDDQELMMRLFTAGDFHLIAKCLYLQRIHAANTQKEQSTNAFIQDQTVRYYEEHIEALSSAWSRRHGKAVVTIRTSTSPPSPDQDPGETLVIDPADIQLPFEDGSVGVIKAVELLQRIPDRSAFFAECHRVLTHGGLILSLTPSTDGRGAFQDPSHVAFYNENSFWYLTQARLREASLPSLAARFQISRIRTYYPTSFDETNDISYVQANLMAIKEGARQGGPLLC
jgi:glycosyltransferase involved in cell wall biosynthesis